MRSKKTCLNAEGFSLMELLMVMVITPVVFFAVYSNFSTGLRIWVKMTQTVTDEDLNIFNIKTGRDLRSMRRFESIPIEGSELEFSFPAAIEASEALGGSRGIGQIKIYYDEDTDTVKREVKDYSQLHRESDGTSAVLLKDVTSFTFSYLTSDPLQSDLVWTGDWEPAPKKLPVAVRMTFTRKGEAKQERTEFIPAGGLIK